MGAAMLKICALAIICTVAGMVLRQMKNDLSTSLKIAGTVLVSGTLLVMAGPVIGEMEEVVGQSGVTEYAKVLIRAIGISLLAKICADVCRDASENSLAGGVEMAAKLEIFLFCIPLIKDIFAYATEILSLM